MARQRMIKPDFFDSESLADCDIQARLLFIGLWVIADDNGNLKLQPRRIGKQVFPYDDFTDEDISGMLAQLESVGCIKCYESGGEEYVNIVNFCVYQTIRKPSKTSIPEPSEKVKNGRKTCFFRGSENGEYGTSTALVRHQVGTSDAKERKKEGNKASYKALFPQRSNEGVPRGAVGLETATARPEAKEEDSWDWDADMSDLMRELMVDA